MVIKTINLVGFLCPIPVHETRRALENSDIGDILEVICDDPETVHDIPALCNRMGIELVRIEELSGEYKFVINNQGDARIQS
jgi:TusA-related sulfurtransferase